MALVLFVVVLFATVRASLLQPFVASEGLRAFAWFGLAPLLLGLFVYLGCFKKHRNLNGRTSFQALILAKSQSKLRIIGRTTWLAASFLFMTWVLCAGVLVYSVWLHKAFATAGISKLVKVESIQVRTGRTFGGYIRIKAVDPQTREGLSFYWPNGNAMYVPRDVDPGALPRHLCIVGDSSVLGVLIKQITPHACASLGMPRMSELEHLATNGLSHLMVPNSALLTGTYTSPLRARHGAAERGR